MTSATPTDVALRFADAKLAHSPELATSDRRPAVQNEVSQARSEPETAPEWELLPPEDEPEPGLWEGACRQCRDNPSEVLRCFAIGIFFLIVAAVLSAAFGRG